MIFYMFALMLLFAAMMTVTVREPVKAVLFLILSFMSGAGLFLTLGAEFLAFIMLIVYVGALAVLFLFVVMMLHFKESEIKKSLKKEGPMALVVGGMLLVQIVTVMWAWPVQKVSLVSRAIEAGDNTRELVRILYTDYVFAFQISGLVLLVAIIGAIVLTLRPRRFVKRQNLHDQLATEARDVVELRNVKTGEGAL